MRRFGSLTRTLGLCGALLGAGACTGEDAPSGIDAGTSVIGTDAMAEREAAIAMADADAANDAAAAADAQNSALPDATTPAQDAAAATPRFSFFVASWRAMRTASGHMDGFGGDLRFGETGEGAGLRGADKICSSIAEQSLPGAGKKPWRAFLSATRGGKDGGPLHAIDRVGEGPWYDRVGRLVANTKADLAQERPLGAHPLIAEDLPNEDGIPNHNPDGRGPIDNHNILTGSDARGYLFDPSPGSTCNDWTSLDGTIGTPRVGHSWVRSVLGQPATWSGRSWISSLNEHGCARGAAQDELGTIDPLNVSVGSGSGYGGIYCFALEP